MISNSVAQQANITRDSISSPQPIVRFLMKSAPVVIHFCRRRFGDRYLPQVYSCLSDCAVMDKLTNIRGGDYRFSYSNLSRPRSAEGEFPQRARAIHSYAIAPLLTQAQSARHRVRPTNGSFPRVNLWKSMQRLGGRCFIAR
jgi:hypothetical protein